MTQQNQGALEGRVAVVVNKNWRIASPHFLRMPSLTPRRPWILEHSVPWKH
jgi:hypothetical protein